MIDEKFSFYKKLLAMTKKEIKSYRMKKPLGCQGAYIYFIAYLHIEVIKDQAYLAFDFVLYYLQKAFYLLAP